MKTIIITNQKGGVGKTTTAINLSYGLSCSGKTTLLIDLDPQANSSSTYCSNLKKHLSISKIFQNEPPKIDSLIIHARVQDKTINNLDLIPSFIDLALAPEEIPSSFEKEKILYNNLAPIRNQYDYIIIDCPPNLGILTINAIFAADLLIIPTTYSKYSLDGISDLLATVKVAREGKDLQYFILRNFYESKNKKTNEFIDNQLANMKGYLLKTVIRKNEAINQSQISDTPVQIFNKKSCGYTDFNELTKEIINISENRYRKAI